MNIEINWLALLLAVVANQVVGFVWYGPLFGKKFMAASGMDKWTPEKQAAEKKKMGLSYFLQFVSSLVTFFVLAGLIVGFGHTTASWGAITAVIIWAGFVVPIKLGEAIWGGNMTLFWLGNGNMLVTFVVAGAILGAW